MSHFDGVEGVCIPLAGTGPTRGGRTVDERLVARFPAIGRGLLRLFSRLSYDSRLRQWLLTRGMARGYRAANRRDFDVMLTGLDPEFEYRAVSAGPGGWVAPDLVGTHRGHAGYRYVWRAMLDGFEDLTLEPQELLVLGDRVICATRMRGHGSGSGAPMDQLLFQVFTFDRGLVVKQEDFAERDAALEAVGRGA